jgi:hypothetical protein
VKGEVVSEPVGCGNDENVVKMLALLVGGVNKKVIKNYPPATTLVVECVPAMFLIPPEWDDLMARFAKVVQVSPFDEVFVTDFGSQAAKSFFPRR